MKLNFLFTMVLLLNTISAYSQSIDNTFQDPLPIRTAKIRCIKTLANNKILIGGDIAFFNTQETKNLIRLNSDYTIDNSFGFNGNQSSIIVAVEPLKNRDIVVLSHGYTSLLDLRMPNCSLYLIDENGTIKKQIDNLNDANSIAIQDSSKILIFENKNSKGYLYRLNSDFSNDQTFSSQLDFNQITDMKISGDKLLVSGGILSDNSLMKYTVVRLNMNGTIDQSFNAGSGTTDPIGSLTVQPDGKILLGKSYINSFNGSNFKGLVRLNSNGTIDSGFTPPSLKSMCSVILVNNSEIFLSASINLNSTDGNYLMKLDSDGKISSSFLPLMLPSYGTIQDFCLSINNNNLIFSSSASDDNNYSLSMCDLKGNLISTFNPKLGRYGKVTVGDYLNGNLVIAGDFVKVNDIETNGIAMLKQNGSVDESFSLKKNMGEVIQLRIIDDLSILVSTRAQFFKLNSRGEIQPDFNFQKFKTLYQVNKFVVLDDGKIFAGDANNTFRLNADGSEDKTFNIGSGMGGTIGTACDFDSQSGKLILGSLFDSFNGASVNKLVRLNTDGSIDRTFDIGTGPSSLSSSSDVRFIKVLDNNEIIVGGDFSSFNGVNIPNHLVKLSENGSLDHAFLEKQKSTTYFNSSALLWTKAEQIGSKIYIKGDRSLIVLNIDGTISYDFNLPSTVSQFSDLIKVRENTQTVKKNALISNNPLNMFALGVFRMQGSSKPTFVLKLSLDNNSVTSTLPELISDSGLLLYPVPTNDKLYIKKPPSFAQSSINIYKINGVLVHSSKITDSNAEIDISKYLPGIYIVKLNTSDGKVLMKKITKQ